MLGGNPILSQLPDGSQDTSHRLHSDRRMYKIGAYTISLSPTARQLVITDENAAKPLWASSSLQTIVQTAVSHDNVVGSSGCWVIQRNDTDACDCSAVTSIRQQRSHGPVEIAGTFAAPCRSLSWTLTFTAASFGPALEFSLALDAVPTDGHNRLILSFQRDASERFFGFGQQYTHLDAAGDSVPIFSREQGIGRGLQPITAALNGLGREAGGDARTTYSAVPHYITSSLRSLHLLNTEPCSFDLRAPGVVTIYAAATTIKGRMFSARTPLELVKRATLYTGRMRPLPDWGHAGAIVGVQGGTRRVLELSERLIEAGVRVAGMWMQDWAGAHEQDVMGMRQMRLRWNWRLDRTRYPNWDGLVANLSARGMRVLTYVNSFLMKNASEADSRYPDALRARALLLDRTGEVPVVISSGPGVRAGILDLTTDRGMAFTASMISEQLALGSSGWMADFGEYVPLDSRPQSGQLALAVHNAYPRLWQEANARAVSGFRRSARIDYGRNDGGEAGGGGGHDTTHDSNDTPVWFARSSGLTSPGIVPLFWLGDQLPTYDVHDGLASVVVGLLSSGMSGHALTHSDIGGYTTARIPGLVDYVRDLELLQRWSELAVFTAFFRTHEGSAPAENVQAYDEIALPHFARCSRLFASLAPYRRRLMAEASTHGWPMVRHMWLHYHTEPSTLDLNAQFMQGADLLVAPVLLPGHRSVRAFVPAGTWLHAFANGTIIHQSHGGWRELWAPLGKPAALVRLDESTGKPPADLAAFMAEINIQMAE